MRNAEFGLTSASSVESRNGDLEKESRFDRLTAGESRTTGHESRPPRTSLAEQSHFAASLRPGGGNGV